MDKRILLSIQNGLALRCWSQECAVVLGWRHASQRYTWSSDRGCGANHGEFEYFFAINAQIVSINATCT